MNRKNAQPRRVEVAVVGIGVRYPGARDARQLWENILGRRRQFRRMPDVRLPIADYQDDDRSVPDKTYGTRAAVIDGYRFDWAGRRIPRQAYESTDIAHWLALDVALQALDDAGLAAADLPRETTQVVVGNTLTGEFTRSNTLRGRWPFVRRMLEAGAADLQLPGATVEALAGAMEGRFKSVFPPINEDTLAGGLANTIAGRICNFLNVNGGGYTVDGACSSSLIAVHAAAASLAGGGSDLALAGGVDISLDPFELIGFAKTGALTPTEMAVYDKRGNGFIPGEGCGFVVLKRLDDAQRDGNRIYAVLDGWGLSSDGKGGITAPSVNGQSLALMRAYAAAGLDSAEMDFIEGHGTGTTVGDRTELLGIARALQGGSRAGAVAPRRCGVTSFKSIVGHTKAAAGIGAFVKAVLGVNQRVIPPTAGCELPHAVFGQEAAGLYPVLRGEVVDPARELRAGVSAMGFGGINVHVTLRSGGPRLPGFEPAVGARAAMVSQQAGEVFCLAAADREGLQAALGALQEQARGASLAELADLACQQHHALEAEAPWRAALVAGTPAQLLQRIDALKARLDTAPDSGALLLDAGEQLAYGHARRPARLGFLFPGQGSQRLGMARMLVQRFDWAAALVAEADAWAAEAGTPGLADSIHGALDRHVTPAEREAPTRQLQRTQIAQPAIVLASLLWLRFLRQLGLAPQAVLGHSLGELTAFHAAGRFDEKTLIQLATLRGQLMAADDGAAGSMASLACDRAAAERLVQAVQDQGVLAVANFNGPAQTVVSGERAAVAALVERAAAEGIQAVPLPVSNAFHSPLVEPASRALRERAVLPSPAEGPPASAPALISSCDGRRVAAELDLRAHFATQIVRPVDFVAALDSLAQLCELAIEVGPGSVLSNMAAQSGQGFAASLPVERIAESAQDLNWLVAALHVHGHRIDAEALYARRVIRPFVPAPALDFLVNPCERPSRAAEGLAAGEAAALRTAAPGAHARAPASGGDPEVAAQLTHYLLQRGDFLTDVIRADLRAQDGGGVRPFVPRRAAHPGSAARATAARAAAQGEAGSGVVTAPAAGAVPAAAIAGPVGAGLGAGSVAGPVAGDTRALVLRLAAEATGFPADRIALDMHLQDDLNLDSIKAGALVADACAALGLAGRVDASAHSGVTLGALADLLDAERPAAAVADAALAAQAGPGTEAPPTAVAAVPAAADALALVLELAAQYTGFAAESIEPGFSFVDDLNLDSIKFAGLIAEAAGRLGLGAAVSVPEGSAASIEAVAAQLQALLPAADAPAQAGAGAAGTAGAANTGGPAGSARPGAARAASRASDAARPPEPPGGGAWARSYVLRLVPEQRPSASGGATAVPDLAGRIVAIQADAEAAPLADAIEAAFEACGATALRFDADSLLASARRDIAHFVVLPSRLRPASGTPAEAAAAAIADTVRHLRSAAVVSARQDAPSSLSYLQFDGLLPDDEGVARSDLRRSGASAFAASLHLERPALKLRVLDFAGEPPASTIAQRLLEELALPEAHGLTHHDARGLRSVPRARCVEPALQSPRGIDWGPDDLVLVTGGAKGITAACALAFAQQTRARLVLVGSSPHEPQTDAGSEIGRTLARFAEAGLSARYRACNLADAAAVAALVAGVEAELGPITGLIHGAGLNTPRRVEQCSEEDACREVAPKLLGLSLLCTALAPRPPKLIVALSSIIGITGMAGNAWYAFANQGLDGVLRRFARVHPQTQTVALAYSVWDEIGMGARLGSTRHLAKMGISAIPPEQGIAHFLHHALRRSAAPQMVVAARLAGLDTWAVEAPRHAGEGRFLQELQVFEPGVEIVNRVALSLDDDRYLRDHHYRGVYLFPTVFGLEAMAQTVARLLGLERFGSLRLEDVQLQRPIVVSGTAGALIEIHALAEERQAAGQPLRLRAGIRTQHTGFRVDHFAARFVLEVQDPAQAMAPRERPHRPTDLEPRSELYGGLLFQGPLFQRMRTIWTMDDTGSLIDVERRAEDDYFAPRHARRLWLGDPALRDVLLQSPQLSEKGTYLPVHIDRLCLYTLDAPAEGLARASNRVTSPFTEDLVCDVIAHAEDGRPIEELTGYRLKRMEFDADSAAPEDFVHPQRRDQRLLRQAVETARIALGLRPPEFRLVHQPGLARLDRSTRRLNELPLFNDVLAQALPAVAAQPQLGRLEIAWRDDGKPVLRGAGTEGAGISLSHDDRHCLCVAGEGAQGCDVEAIAPRSVEAWTGLLGERRMALARTLAGDAGSLDEAATRVWCALECGIKALGHEALELRIEAREAEAVVFACSAGPSTARVLTLALALTRLPRKVVAMVVRAAEVPAAVDIELDAPAEAADGPADAHHVGVGPQGQPMPCFRFRVTFKETTTLRNSLDLQTYANWMGDIRELAIADSAQHLVPDFASGRWGMVTNESQVRVIADAHCMDVIEGRMYISRAFGRFDSSIDMHFEWWRIGGDGTAEPIAVSTMSTTWVEIKGHGVVEVQPFPPYLQDFVTANLPAQAGAPPVPGFLEAGPAWSRGSAALGAVLYEAPNAPKVEPELLRQSFATSSAESNLVGNIYFSNYYHWQKRVIDRYLHKLAPELATAGASPGEFHWRRSEIRHLREAMPYDEIEVVMALRRLSEHGLALHFEYHRVEGGQRIKLAYGECEAVWVSRGEQQPSRIPLPYRTALRAEWPAAA